MVRSFAAKQMESWINSAASSEPILLTLFGIADLNLGAISSCRIQLDSGGHNNFWWGLMETKNPCLWGTGLDSWWDLGLTEAKPSPRYYPTYWEISGDGEGVSRRYAHAPIDSREGKPRRLARSSLLSAQWSGNGARTNLSIERHELNIQGRPQRRTAARLEIAIENATVSVWVRAGSESVKLKPRWKKICANCPMFAFNGGCCVIWVVVELGRRRINSNTAFLTFCQRSMLKRAERIKI